MEIMFLKLNSFYQTNVHSHKTLPSLSWPSLIDTQEADLRAYTGLALTWHFFLLISGFITVFYKMARVVVGVDIIKTQCICI